MFFLFFYLLFFAVDPRHLLCPELARRHFRPEIQVGLLTIAVEEERFLVRVTILISSYLEFGGRKQISILTLRGFRLHTKSIHLFCTANADVVYPLCPNAVEIR